MDERLINPFLNSTKDIFKQMANIDVEIDGQFYNEKDDIISLGLSSVISFTGKNKGRLLLDMEPQLALTIAENLTGTRYNTLKEYMVLASISEINNIIAGDANTHLNNEYSLGLRLAPPIVFAGKEAVISIPKISSASVNCITPHGKFRVNVAFERGL